MPPETRLKVILAWPKKKFTKNFSIGKNNRSGARKLANSTA
jgi:hypothetical protein